MCLPVLLITTSVRIAANSSELYRYGFNKYDISQVTGLAPAELDKVITGLISYFNSNEEYINLTVIKDGKPFTLFNEREVSHLKDVKGLFRLVCWLLLGTLIYAVIYAALNYTVWKDRRRVAWGLIGGSGLTTGAGDSPGADDFTEFRPVLLRFPPYQFRQRPVAARPGYGLSHHAFPAGFLVRCGALLHPWHRGAGAFPGRHGLVAVKKRKTGQT